MNRPLQRPARPPGPARPASAVAIAAIAAVALAAGCAAPAGPPDRVVRYGVSEYLVTVPATGPASVADPVRVARMDAVNTCAVQGHHAMVISEVKRPDAFELRFQCQSVLP